MNSKSSENRLLSWFSPEDASSKERPLPKDFSEGMAQYVQNAWGFVPASLADEAEKESASNASVVVSLQAWKARHPDHPKVVRSRIGRGHLVSTEKLAVGHSAAKDAPAQDIEELPLYCEVGSILHLESEAPSGELYYIAVLLLRGEEDPILAYPYDKSDLYRPMQSLRLEWQAETGPTQRTFVTLFSEEPLFPIETLFEKPEGGWTTVSQKQVLKEIDWDRVLAVKELHWECSS